MADSLTRNQIVMARFMPAVTPIVGQLLHSILSAGSR